MREITLIGAYGLSEDQIAVLKKNAPTVKCEIMDTDCFNIDIQKPYLGLYINKPNKNSYGKDL